METNVNFDATLNSEAAITDTPIADTPITASTFTTVKDLASNDKVWYALAFGAGMATAKFVPVAYKWVKRTLTK